MYHRGLHAVAQGFLEGVDGFLITSEVVIDVGKVHIGPEVFGVNAEGVFVWVDALFVLAHHAVGVTDVGPGLAVVRIFVDQLLEIVDGFFLAAGAEVATPYLVVDGVFVFGECQGFVVELEGEVILAHVLVFVGDGVVELELLVFVKIGQGAEVVLQGFFRLAQHRETGA